MNRHFISLAILAFLTLLLFQSCISLHKIDAKNTTSLHVSRIGEKIPSDIQNQMSELPFDTSHLLNETEGQFLNFCFDIDSFDFCHKKVCFFSGSFGTTILSKKVFVIGVKETIAYHDTDSRVAPLFCYIIRDESLRNDVGYDAFVLFGDFLRRASFSQMYRSLEKLKRNNPDFVKYSNQNDSIGYVVLQELYFNPHRISQNTLNHMDKTGLDNSPFLNRYESALLSEMLPESLKWFNFSGKKVGFIDVSHNMGFVVINYGKKGYFENLKRHYSNEKIFFDNGMLYILNDRQKKESGGFDVAIVCGNYFVLSEENIVKRLKKYKVEEE
jgi:hypothetical protein